MTEDQQNKIRDFLLNMRQFHNRSVFALAAILYKESEREQVADIVEKNGLPRIIIADQHEDELLAPILDRIAQGKGIVLEVVNVIPPKVFSVLSELFQQGTVNVHLSGEAEPRVINPYPQGSFVVLMMTPETYKNMHGTFIINAVCNIAIESVPA